MNVKEIDNLLSTAKFERIKSKNDIPKKWWSAMGLADTSDVGGPFDAGCTGSAPHTRFIAAGISEPYAFLVAESGGVVYWKTLNVFKDENGSISKVYAEQGLTEARLKTLCDRL